MEKIQLYLDLVKKRKGCFQCTGLFNPIMVANGQYDSEQIGPWSIWQGYLNAEIIVVGQDWGDRSYFTNGKEETNHQEILLMKTSKNC